MEMIILETKQDDKFEAFWCELKHKGFARSFHIYIFDEKGNLIDVRLYYFFNQFTKVADGKIKSKQAFEDIWENLHKTQEEIEDAIRKKYEDKKEGVKKWL